MAKAGITRTTLQTTISHLRKVTGQDVPGHGGLHLQTPRPSANDARKMEMRDAAIEKLFADGASRESVRAKLGTRKSTFHDRLKRIRERLGRDLPGQGSLEYEAAQRLERGLRGGSRAAEMVAMFERGATREDVQMRFGLADTAFHAFLTWTRKRLGKDLPGHGARREGGFAKKSADGNHGPTPPAKLEKRHEAFEALETAERCPVCRLLVAALRLHQAARARAGGMSEKAKRPRLDEGLVELQRAARFLASLPREFWERNEEAERVAMEVYRRSVPSLKGRPIARRRDPI